MFIRPVFFQTLFLGLMVHVHLHLVGVMFCTRGIATAVRRNGSERGSFFRKLCQQNKGLANVGSHATFIAIRFAILRIPHIGSAICRQVNISALVALVIAQWNAQRTKICQHLLLHFLNSFYKKLELGFFIGGK